MAAAPITATPFLSAYALLDTVVMRAGGSTPIIRVSGIAMDHAGNYAIADASERTVRVFGRDGRLLRSVGRDGDGPGEFRQPRYLAFSSDGRLLVGESSGRIHWFDGDSVLATHQLDGLPFITMLALVSDSLLVATSLAGDSAALRLHGPDGTLKRSITITNGVPVSDQPANPRWRNFWQPRGAACGATVAVAGSVADSVWFVGAASGEIASRQVVPMGYRPPSMTEAAEEIEAGNRMRWIHAYDVVQGMMCDGSRFGFAYVRGVRNFGDPQTLMLGSADGPWAAYSESPPVLALAGDTLLAIHDPDADALVLARYVPRRTGAVE